MKLVSGGKAVGFLVSNGVHHALRDAASAGGLSVAQMAEVLIRRSLSINADAASLTDPDPGRHQAEANRAALRQMQAERDAARLDIAGLKIALTRAEADADHWRKTAERENDALAEKMVEAAQHAEERAALEDQIGQLRSRLAEMEVALAAPVKISKKCELTGMLDENAPDALPPSISLSEADMRLVCAYRSAGWTAPSIAREMKITLVAVNTALGRK